MSIDEGDVTTMDLDELGDEIAKTFVAIDQATQRALAMLRVFDDRGGWAASGNTSCAAWLSWRTGMAPGTARERMRIAHRLAELPTIDEAFAGGELSYSKVRALTRIADADSEEVLLGDARLLTGAQLERLVGNLRGRRWRPSLPKRARRSSSRRARFASIAPTTGWSRSPSS